MKSRPVHLLRMRQATKAAASFGRAPLIRPQRVANSPTNSSFIRPASLSFHTSSRSLNQDKESEAEKKARESAEYTKKSEEAKKRTSNVTDTPQSPFRVFVQTLREELQKNREYQEDVARLQGDVDKLADSETMKKAREAYERARLTNLLKNNPKLAAAAEEMKKAGLKVGDGVSEALKGLEESEFMRQLAKTSAKISSGVATATAPVRETEAYKALSDSITEAFDESTRYGGYEEKEDRRKRRLARAEKAGRLNAGKPKRQRVEENPEAGSALVATDKKAESSGWLSERLANSPTYNRWNEAYYESENPVVSGVRTVTSAIGRFFDENETAQVVRKIKELDPDFQMEAFARDLREYIVPEVVDAYLHADKASLKMWCGEATYNVLWATMQQYVKQGLVSDSKVLDIREVDVSSIRNAYLFPSRVCSA